MQRHDSSVARGSRVAMGDAPHRVAGPCSPAEMGIAPHGASRIAASRWMHPNEGSDMHPHSPQDRRAGESSEFAPAERRTERDMAAPPSRSTVVPMLIAGLVLAVIVVLVLLL
jgi:hypothetical protein